MARRTKGDTKPRISAFNTPFKELKRRLQPETVKAPPRPLPPAPVPVPAELGEGELFQQAMAGVVRLPEGPLAAPLPAPREPRVTSDDAEAFARLAELVSGEGPFDISDTDEHIEGAAPGVDKRLLVGLRQGQYAVQGHLDLHGLTRAEAKDAVERYLGESQRAGKRCVLLVHGRGLNSKDQIPVLKEQLKVWLRRGRIGRAVLAFSTARPHDGGAGAIYVLLRR